MSTFELLTYFCLFGLLVAFLYHYIYPLLLNAYFKSDSFTAIKNTVQQHVAECNDLNDHIEDLKYSYSDVASTNYGEADLTDSSRYNMNRPKWAGAMRDSRTYRCSSSVAKSADDQPFKYFCKYFNVSPDKDSLDKFEQALNNFAAAEQGKYLLANERDSILFEIRNSIPSFLQRHHQDRINEELGLKRVSLAQLYFPVYTFQYVSAGGNSRFSTSIEFNITKLEEFIVYLADLVNFRDSVAGQRALMTAKLREEIKTRDGYTCQACGLSTEDEPNLLLEIDHIIPLSKGGVTSKNNLQTLCWKCNRSKGSKILNHSAPERTSLKQALPVPETPPPLPTMNDQRSSESKVLNSTSKLDMTRPKAKPQPSSGTSKLDMTRPKAKPQPSSGISKLDMTKAETNAARSAKDDLRYSSYSRKGLIEQLYEIHEYTKDEAKTAVDSLDVDWKEQAVKSAEDNLRYSSYSRKGLIEQLYEIQEYTKDEAAYAAEKTGVCS